MSKSSMSYGAGVPTPGFTKISPSFPEHEASVEVSVIAKQPLTLIVTSSERVPEEQLPTTSA